MFQKLTKTMVLLLLASSVVNAQTEKVETPQEVVSQSNVKPIDDIQPDIDLATRALENIETMERGWATAYEKVERALEAQNRGYSLFVEAATATAMRDCAIQIRKDGVELIASYKELAQQNGTLKSALFKGPKYLNELSQKFREYGEAERFEDVRARYFELAELWAARAALLDKRGNAIHDFYDPDVVAYLESFNQLVDRLLPVLEVDFSADGQNAGQFSIFANKLTEHLDHLRKFSSSITTWRDAALKDAADPEIRLNREERKTKEKFDKIGVEIVPDLSNPAMVSLKKGVGKDLVEQDSILIVRLDPTTKNLAYLGTAQRQQTGKFKLMEPKQTKLTGQERALLPDANLPSEFESKGALRDALQVIRRNHDMLAAYEQERESDIRNFSLPSKDAGPPAPAPSGDRGN